MPVDWNKIFDAAGQLGQVAGASAGGQAEGRLAEAKANLGGADIDLARKRYLNAAPSLYTSQNLISDVLGNAGRLKLNVPGLTGHAEGGLSPDLIGQGTKDAASALASSARTKMGQLPTSMASGPGQYFGNAPDLMPQPSALSKILGVGGTVGQLAGSLKGLIPSVAKAAAPSAASTLLAGTGALPGVGIPTSALAAGTPAAGGGLGSTLGALATNPITIGAGAALAIGLAIKHHQNATKGDRNSFAKDAGFPDLAAFNNYLSTLGPAGQAARTYGENVVGKHNKQQEQQWLSMVQQAISQGRA